MKNRSLIMTGLALVWLLPFSRADIMDDWEFNDSAGTVLANTLNSGSGGDWFQTEWGDSIGNSSTTGDGIFRVQREIGGTSVVLAEINYTVPDVVWMVVDLDGWALSPTFDDNMNRPNEDLRFGFARSDNTSSSANRYAEIWLGRRASLDQVFLQGVGELTEEGAGWIPPQPIGLSNIEDRPLRLVLKLDRAAQEYSVYYNLDNEGYVHLGTADLDPTNDPYYIKFQALNGLHDPLYPEDPNSPREYVDVDRIYVTSVDPIDEALIDPPVVPEPELRVERDWQFNEAEGTGMRDTVDSAGDAWWTTDTHSNDRDLGYHAGDGVLTASTTGDGAFRIQRAVGAGQHAHSYLERQWTGKKWLVADFRGWFFNTEEGNANEHLEFGFIDDFTTNRYRAASFYLARYAPTDEEPELDPNQVYLGGFSSGPFSLQFKGEDIDRAPVFDTDQDEPVRIVLEYDVGESRYALYYRVGDGEYELLGEADTDPSAGPNALSIYVTNSFADPGEFVDLERLRVTTIDPMTEEEPAGYAAWADANFPDGGPDAAVGADPDGDGIPNILEYVLGLNPNVPDRSGLPVVEMEEHEGEHYLTITVDRDEAATDVDLLVEVGNGLGLDDWTSGDGVTTTIEDTPARLKVRDNTPIGTENRRFIRVVAAQDE